MTRVPYSTDPDDLFNPGRAEDFFAYGPPPSDEALCAEMARLAYLRHEDPGGRSKLEEILKTRAGFELGPCFNTGGTQGFVASQSSPDGSRVTVVAFRGTEPGESVDLRQDSHFFFSSWGTGGARVHTGFAQAFTLVRDQFLNAMWGVPGRLLLTGHSLGAGVATLAASVVPVERRAQTVLCTIGSPRVGNEAFVASLRWLTHYRYAGARDLVTWVPPVEPIPYQHHGILRCIDAAGALHEFKSDEAAHTQAASVRGSGPMPATLYATFLALVARQVPARELADHAPINYMSGIWGLR